MIKPEGEGAFKCPRCNATTTGDMAYCMECGKDLNIRCPGCATTWRFYYEHPFCPYCGTKVRGTKLAARKARSMPPV